MDTATKLITADELSRMKCDGRCELIHGELFMMSPAGMWHGLAAMRIGQVLGNYVTEHDFGIVLAAETGFKIESDPDTVRAPDVSFLKKSRVEGKITARFFAGTPDLAVEVISPDDSRRAVIDKANMWLANGTQVVWVADPAKATLSIQRVGVPAVILQRGGRIEHEPLLPGFSLDIDLIFKLP